MKRLFISILSILMIGVACSKPDSGDTGRNDSGEYVPTGKITVKGLVCSDATPLEGVVVSDGVLCVRTDKDGRFEIDSDLKNTRFIHVSMPSGYVAPSSSNGIPQFYHPVTDAERNADLCEHTFNLEKVEIGDPERFTMLICADPQTRDRNANFDKIAYHSLDCAEDLYKDMAETAGKIKGRQVYGLTLGDIVHEKMNHFPYYISGVKTIKDASERGKFQMHTVIGNHDNDPTAENDAEGRRVFEGYFGPVNYSFNIGKIHFICVDNLIMRQNNSGDLKNYDQGLTDDLWQWLQNDLRYVSRDATIMIAAHSPMFRLQSGSDRWDSAATRHGYDYKNLLSKFRKVHAWAGHTHVNYWYNYPAGHPCENIEVHTLARSTGELWTNEYLSANQPRGYVVMEVDGDDVSWYFKPTAYQKGDFLNTKVPAYKYRDWTKGSDGQTLYVDNRKLDESYQMKVYKPGEYEDNYIYVDVFLWDDKWEYPVFEGTKMTKVSSVQSYSLAHKEIFNHYYTYGPQLNASADYAATYYSSDYPPTLFRVRVSKQTGSGTVKVKDRFGKEYSRRIQW